MSLMMMLAMGRKKYVPTPYSRTFSSSGTFVVPTGVTMLDSASGHGGPGQPASSTPNSYYTNVVTKLYRRDGGVDTVSDNVDGWGFGTGNGTDYCDPMTATPDSTVYYQQQRCYYYKVVFGSSTPATTGASSTGFGKVFAGGTGGPATSDTTFTNVPVTSGASYSVVVPSGGSITITWKV